MDCCYIRGWTANRDDSFLFYLLGKIGNKDLEGRESMDAGEMLAHSLLTGNKPEEALSFCNAWHDYNSEIKCLADRIANAMGFLEQNKKETGLRGKPIITMLDVFLTCRKRNAKMVKGE